MREPLTPQPLYNTIVGVQTIFHTFYNESKMYNYIVKSVLSDHLGSSNDPCYIQNGVIMNCVIRRLKCTSKVIGCQNIYIQNFHGNSVNELHNEKKPTSSEGTDQHQPFTYTQSDQGLFIRCLDSILAIEVFKTSRL